MTPAPADCRRRGTSVGKAASANAQTSMGGVLKKIEDAAMKGLADVDAGVAIP
jgi:hypothetical protein